MLHENRLIIKYTQKKEFFSRLSKQQNLKRLNLGITDKESLACLVDLIEAKSDAEDFQLSLTMNGVKWFKGDDDSDESAESDGDDCSEDVRYNRTKALFIRLATSVANSSSSFRIRRVLENELEYFVWHEIEREPALKFFKSVVGMAGNRFCLYGRSLWADAANFPNMETYTLASDENYTEDLKTFDASAFPPSLKLQVEFGFPAPVSLPSTLTHLEIQYWSCTVNDYLQGLFSLAEECPSLKNLKLSWNDHRCCYFHEEESDPSYGFQSFATSSQFKGLKSLEFVAEDLGDETGVAVCRMILLHGFKLPQLTLSDLKLSFIRDPFRLATVMDHNMLIALNCGPISKSLCNVDIDARYVLKDAHPLLEILKSTAAANKMERMETLGKERGNQLNR